METFPPYEGGLYAGISEDPVPGPVSNDYLVDLLETEKKIARLAIFEQECERSFIAYKLQEDLAQTLAATKLYLEFAEQSNDMKDHFIQRSKEAIGTVINEIQYLCRSMVPSTLEKNSPDELTEDMVAEWGVKNNIPIDFLCRADLGQVSGDISLAIFRIIQQQLRLGACCHAKEIAISIIEKEGIHLYFSMGGMDFINTDTQAELLIKNIITRVEMVSGEMRYMNNLSENDVMYITIPHGKETGRYLE